MRSTPLIAPLLATLMAPLAHGHGPVHSIALVNDPLSHGQLGDNLLSLNEVIQLNQRTLMRSQLSLAEQGQIFGFGTDVAGADIDFGVVQQITFERDLDVIEDQPHGTIISGYNGTPVLDIGSTNGIVANSNYMDVRGVEIRGGACAITLTQTTTGFGSAFGNCVFRGQTSCAVSVTLAQASGNTRVEFEDCKFINLPKAIEVFDTGANRQGTLTFDGLDIQGGQQGVLVHVGPGGVLNITIERTTITGTTQGIVIDRPTAADTRQLIVNALHVIVGGGDTGFSFEGHPSVLDFLTLRVVDFGGTSYGMRIGPPGLLAQTLIEDSRLSGGQELRAGPGLLGVDLANVRVKNGNLSIESAGAPIQISDAILDGVSTTTQGSVDLQIDDCRFVGGSLQGQPNAAIHVQNSHMGGATIGPDVTVSGSLPAPQLGSLEITPYDPAMGSSVTLQCDLPPGLFGFWAVGVAETMPIIGPRPFHVYFFLSAHVVLPIQVRNQDQLTIPIPVAITLKGVDWVAQLAVLPDAGLLAPLLSLPPGRRFRTL